MNDEYLAEFEALQEIKGELRKRNKRIAELEAALREIADSVDYGGFCVFRARRALEGK